MSYVPPNPLVLRFTTSYVAPTASVTVEFKNNSAILPGQIETELFGVAELGTTRALSLLGIDAAFFGASRVFLNSLKPIGLNSLLFGQSQVTSYALPEDQPVNVTSIATLGMGATSVASSIREVYPPDFISMAAGTPLVAYRERFVYPQWFTTLFIGSAQIGGARQLSISGFFSEDMGNHRARDNRQLVEQAGALNDGSVGFPFVALAVRDIRTQFLPPESVERIGSVNISNSTKYVTPAYIASQWINDAYGEPYLFNRNRVIDLVINGIKPPFRSVSPFATIANNARAVVPNGFEEVFGSHLAAYRIRSVYPVGFDSFFQIPQFHVVFNRADVAAPGGFNAGAIPFPSVVNTRRYMPPVGLAPDDVCGVPFVAPRVRLVSPPIGIQPILMEGTTVWRGTRLVAPATMNWPFSGSSFGNLAFSIVDRSLRCPNIVVAPPSWGEARLSNRTPYVGPYWDSDLFTKFGQARIFNRNNFFEQSGFNNQSFGAAQVEYRTKKLTVITGDMQRHGLQSVRNVIPDPPKKQYAFQVSFSSLGFGSTKIHANSIYPKWDDNGAFGQAKVFVNSIRPLGMPPYFDQLYSGQFGIASLNGPQTVSCSFISEGVSGFHRVTPHTIYCGPAPAQAVINHPEPPFHLIDFYSQNGVERPIVSNQHRQVFALGFKEDFAFGSQHAFLNPAIFVINAIKSFRPGFPTITSPNQILVQSIGDTSGFGRAEIGHVESLLRYLRPAGISDERFPLLEVQLKNRSVSAPAMNQQSFGGTVVQRPPPPVEPHGEVASVWGNNMVAYRIRYAAFQGFDSLVCDYDPDNFELRMRVTKRNYVRHLGLSGQLLGDIVIGPRPVYRIGPDGFTNWQIQLQSISHV